MAPAAAAAAACASSVRADPPGILDYGAIHACLLGGDRRASLPALALLLLLHFRFLAAAAGSHFSPAVSRLAARLRLSPSMAAVTLLALGNGAPDAFASAAALGGAGGMRRAGLAAILSAGAFVSAFVVGAVALIAAPFAVPPASFARDVFFYLLAASGLFYIYLSAEIYLWQAIGLVLFYVFFVGLVVYMDLDAEGKAVSATELEVVNGIGRVVMDLPVTMEDRKQQHPTLCTIFSKKEAPITENIASTTISFVMSVFWISTMAGELLNCLAAIGLIMDFPPAILGMTVLAWGNSVGDLVADVALAKSGQPTIAIAGCFAGPMFNMLVGLGTALVIQTARVYPKAYVLEFHVGIVVAFVFLLLSLMGTLLMVTWTRFRVPSCYRAMAHFDGDGSRGARCLQAAIQLLILAADAYSPSH
uniref:Sodium/calcium exchanger membrane region domain-containing protein n=1 Tax=Oryza meridionalis TaxID=40149 RepID=A0A0E0F2K3_9ORYZ